MQMYGLLIGYGKTADGNSYAAYTDDTSSENSNNIFPYNILWVSAFIFVVRPTMVGSGTVCIPLSMLGLTPLKNARTHTPQNYYRIFRNYSGPVEDDHMAGVVRRTGLGREDEAQW